jgi:hypothetical protein
MPSCSYYPTPLHIPTFPSSTFAVGAADFDGDGELTLSEAKEFFAIMVVSGAFVIIIIINSSSLTSSASSLSIHHHQHHH